MEYKIGSGQRVISIGHAKPPVSPPQTPKEKLQANAFLTREHLKFKKLQEQIELLDLKLQFDETCDRIDNTDYWEIESEFLPAEQLKLANLVTKCCAESLGIKHPGAISIRFFEIEPERCKGYIRQYGVRDWRHFRGNRNLIGKADSKYLSIWLKATLTGEDLIETAAHEAYHVARPKDSEEQAAAYGLKIRQSFLADN